MIVAQRDVFQLVLLVMCGNTMTLAVAVFPALGQHTLHITGGALPVLPGQPQQRKVGPPQLPIGWTRVVGEIFISG